MSLKEEILSAELLDAIADMDSIDLIETEPTIIEDDTIPTFLMV